MRPIMSNKSALTERLVKKLKELSDPPGMFAKKTIEFLVKGSHFHVQMSPFQLQLSYWKGDSNPSI
jgi:hypothetical protein